MKNLSFDNANSRCIPYDAPPPELLRQLRRLAVEGCPAACAAACTGARRSAGRWNCWREVTQNEKQ